MRARRFRESQESKGLREVRVWVPDNPAALEQVKYLAVRLRKHAPKPNNQPSEIPE